MPLLNQIGLSALVVVLALLPRVIEYYATPTRRDEE